MAKESKLSAVAKDKIPGISKKKDRSTPEPKVPSGPDEPPAHIRVRGEASRWAPADFADVSFTVRQRASTSGAAVAAASETYQALEKILDANRDVIERRTTVALSVHQVSRWDPESGKEIRQGFEASRTETVRFAPPADAGKALRSIATSVRDLAVGGPWFGLRPDNPVQGETRAAAASEARAIAVDFARGVGLDVGEVRWLSDPALSGPGAGWAGDGGGVGARYAMAAKADGTEDQGPVLVDLTNEDVEVRSVIDVEFGLSRP